MSDATAFLSPAVEGEDRAQIGADAPGSEAGPVKQLVTPRNKDAVRHVRPRHADCCDALQEGLKVHGLGPGRCLGACGTRR